MRTVILACAIAATVTGAQSQPMAIDQLNWLAGCWSSEKGEPGSGEFWLPPAGGMMLGIGRTIRGGRTIEHEFMSLHVGQDARLVYTARPSRQNEAAFVATEVTAETATFENPAHDFPQRITYRLVSKETLLVRIDGTRQGQRREVDFAFRRMPCQG